MTQLPESQEERRLQRLLGHLARQDMLVLDELGYVPFTKAGPELPFEVVSQAYERQSLMVTTNLPFEQRVEVCGSERLTGAMLDRLTHRVHIVEANGQSTGSATASGGSDAAEGRLRQPRQTDRAVGKGLTPRTVGGRPTRGCYAFAPPRATVLLRPLQSIWKRAK